MYDVLAYLPDINRMLRIQEGCGDNLLAEDRKEGYVDYVNYDLYSIHNGSLTAEDGGMILYKDMIPDQLTCIETHAMVRSVIDDYENRNRPYQLLEGACYDYWQEKIQEAE